MEGQRNVAEELRREGYTLDDSEVERLAYLDAYRFDSEVKSIRRNYERRPLNGFELAHGRTDETAVLQRALDYSTKQGVSYAEAKRILENQA
jgi:hypothetical protein